MMELNDEISPSTLLPRLTNHDELTIQNGIAPEPQNQNTSSPIPTPQDTQLGDVITRIEDVFESILGSILDGDPELSIALKRKPKGPLAKNPGTPISSSDDERVTKVRFPTKSSNEARRFCALLGVLTASHEALVTGNVTTKRDVFYKDPGLFIKQSLSDRCLDEISFTLGVGRDSLNVVAAAKGLLAGSVRIHTNDENSIDYSSALEGFLIPNVKQILKVEPQDLKWVLVIEKEATFRGLAKSQYWAKSTAGKGLLITAKGYPDLQSRQFLNLLHLQNMKIPIFALVDYDPDGFGIISIYKYGSMALVHESNSTVPTIEWLGIRSKDAIRINKYKGRQEKDLTGLLQLSARDRRIATKMLEKDAILGEHGSEKEWRMEIQMMLMLNVKAEIQILESGIKFDKWLDSKLRAGRAAYKKQITGKS